MRALALILVALLTVAVAGMPVFLWQSLRRRRDPVALRTYWRTLAIGIDQVGGSLLYGTEDYTVSAWTHHLCADLGRRCWLERLIDRLFYPGHCAASWRREQEGKR